MELKRKILDRIEDEMKKIGMSQGELGRQLDVKRTDVNRYLRGTLSSVSFERLIEMAETVGLEVDVKINKKRQTNK